METPVNDNAPYRRKYGFKAWCRRYISFPLVGIVVVMSVILFMTDSSVFNTYAFECQIEELKNEIREHQDTLQYYEDLNRRLDTDPATMEQIVREHFHMRRPNEDVFIIEK
ncbi:MAG: septum formation initiator family protein [Paramuribaculum sp.]|nr:septum formation initiator family protein [Paramuribaculum sp.]